MLTVNEIFHSIQGESTYTGEPCVFVRLTACDLRCSWCDTSYAFYEGRKRDLDDVMTEVESFECPLVEITGGEPLLQEDVYPLMERLLSVGHTVLLETGGHLDVGKVPAGVVKIVDIKCPASGEADKQDWGNIDRLLPHDQVKFVIQDENDYQYARDVVRRHHLDKRCAAVLFSPVHGVLDP
jgi:7-carboxy-7-deazaguanine synthase